MPDSPSGPCPRRSARPGQGVGVLVRAHPGAPGEPARRTFRRLEVWRYGRARTYRTPLSLSLFTFPSLRPPCGVVGVLHQVITRLEKESFCSQAGGACSVPRGRGAFRVLRRV